MADDVSTPNEADAHAAEAVERHHAHMSGTLRALAERLVDAADAVDERAAASVAGQLADWCEGELLPHARAEEGTLYAAAARTAEGRLLIDGMLAEHQVVMELVGQLREQADPVRLAATATALRVVFDGHLAKENELVVPLLLRTPDVSVAALLGGMHELIGDEASPAGAPPGSPH